MDKLKYIKLENEDGSYSESIPLAVQADYVDVNVAGETETLADYIDSNNTNITGLQNTAASLSTRVSANTTAIQGLASGAPKGTYETTTALVSANPATGVYIVTNDGHIYSWTKDGSTPTDLGVYQATELEEKDMVALQYVSNCRKLDKETLNLFKTYWIRGYNLDNTTGIAYKDTSNARLMAKDYILVDVNTKYVFKIRNFCFKNATDGVNTYCFCYDSNLNFLGYRAFLTQTGARGNTDWLTVNGASVNPFYENTTYIRFVIRTATVGNIPDDFVNMQTFFYDATYNQPGYKKEEPGDYIKTEAIDFDWWRADSIESKVNSMMVATNNKLIGHPVKGWYHMRKPDEGRVVYSEDYTDRGITLEFSPISGNTKYKIVNSQGAGGSLNKILVFYDEDKNFISEQAGAYNDWITSPENAAYLRLAFVRTAPTSTDTDVACAQPWMVLEENADTTDNPGYKIKTDYIDYDFEHIPSSGVTEEKVKELIRDEDQITETDIINGFKKVMAHNREGRYFNFGFFTDTHSNLQNAADSIKYMHKIANNELVDMNFHGGDIISTYDPIDSVDKYVEAMLPHLHNYKEIKNLFFVKGNHDEGHVEGAENNLSKYQYNALFSPSYKDNDVKIHYNELDDYGNYYYVDLEHYKIRIIVIDSFYNPGLNSVDYGSYQLPWVATEALDDTNLTSDWSILVFSHTIGNNDNMGKLFKAYNTKSTYQTYNFTEAKCKFIGTVLGHEHTDNYSNAGGFNRIGVTCAFGASPAVDIFTIDTENDIVYETRIGGRGTDRAYRYGATSEQIVEE